jgi:hypothetical protein
MPPVARQRAAQHAPAHARAHQAERPQVISSEPRDLIDGPQRSHPGSQAQFTAAPGGEGADRIVVLDQEGPLVHLLGGRDGLAGQVEIGGEREVGPRGVAEDPELRAEPRIEVQQVVLAIPGVQPDIEVEQAAIAEPGEQRGDLVAQLVVRDRAAAARQSEAG